MPHGFSQGGLGAVWAAFCVVWPPPRPASRTPPRWRHLSPPTTGSGRAPAAPTEGPSPHPVPSALCPCTSGAATRAQGRGAFLLFFLFPFYVVCGHIMEGELRRVLFSCQPELLIQLGFFLSAFLSFFPVDFILGNGKVTGWQCQPSHQPPTAKREAASPGKHPGLLRCRHSQRGGPTGASAPAYDSLLPLPWCHLQGVAGRGSN